MDKVKVFNSEYQYISDKNTIEDTKTLVQELPDYFFKVPASSTGKYHPAFAISNGGLVKHTKLAVRIAHDLLENESIGYKFSTKEKDLIIMALILHDGLKKGIKEEKWTCFDHPLLSSKFIMERKDKLSLSIDDVRLLCSIIESHMGQWNSDKFGKIVMPKPTTEIARFVHMCDFLSSKKYVNANFKGDELID